MCLATAVPAQAQTAGERFGIGMFSYQNSTFVGLAMRYPTEPQEIGGVVVELPAAGDVKKLVETCISDSWSCSRFTP